MVKYWVKLIECQDYRANIKCYLYQQKRAEEGKSCWALHIRTLLFKYGFGFVWEMQGVGNSSRFIREFSQRVRDVMHQDWRADIHTFGVMRTYTSIKFNLELEWFLKLDIPRYVIRQISRLRSGLLHIEVNQGRWKRTELENRTCQICNLNVLEDEYHIIFICPVYVSYRLPLFRKFNIRHYQSIRDIFERRNVELLIALAKYIKQILEFRAAILDVL